MSYRVRFTAELLDDNGLVVSKITGNGDQMITLQAQLGSALVLNAPPVKALDVVKAQAVPKPQVAPKPQVPKKTKLVDRAELHEFVARYSKAEAAVEFGISKSTVVRQLKAGRTGTFVVGRMGKRKKAPTKRAPLTLAAIKELIKKDFGMARISKESGFSEGYIYQVLRMHSTSIRQLRNEMEKSGEIQLYEVPGVPAEQKAVS